MDGIGGDEPIPASDSIAVSDPVIVATCSELEEAVAAASHETGQAKRASISPAVTEVAWKLPNVRGQEGAAIITTHVCSQIDVVLEAQHIVQDQQDTMLHALPISLFPWHVQNTQTIGLNTPPQSTLHDLVSA
ncbi:hypothetical protein BaRGS_00002340 [Batillaria attramentaria]|uniref:Uncharacterized protein n=1 Tax=Batillaria attramentaria TaxID=370345 RepID=A0ABD0M3G3_9CAEN